MECTNLHWLLINAMAVSLGATGAIAGISYGVYRAIKHIVGGKQ